LAGWLSDQGVALNGIALLSTVLNFETLVQTEGNDLAYVGFLPSYTATAWYHKHLPPDLQSQPLESVLRQAERWADRDYLLALHQGTRLSKTERQTTIAQMARLTGLSPAFIEQNDLRVPLGRFNQELLRDRKLTLARYDSRFTAYSLDPASE